MKIAVVLSILLGVLFACSGDCMQCHPALKKSIEEKHHVILKTCIQCHTKTPQAMNSCGGDCFSCHSKKKLIQSDRMEHRQIRKCQQCHIGKEELLNIVDRSSNLIDILNQK